MVNILQITHIKYYKQLKSEQTIELCLKELTTIEQVSTSDNSGTLHVN